jgi:hypothetical protein
MLCSYCSDQINNDQEREIKHGALLSKITYVFLQYCLVNAERC